jgi:hypothetical protein
VKVSILYQRATCNPGLWDFHRKSSAPPDQGPMGHMSAVLDFTSEKGPYALTVQDRLTVRDRTKALNSFRLASSVYTSPSSGAGRSAAQLTLRVKRRLVHFGGRDLREGTCGLRDVETPGGAPQSQADCRHCTLQSL